MADKVQIPDFMSWATSMGEEALRKKVRDHLAEMKDSAEAAKNAAEVNGSWWNDIVEPNDNNDQWKQGGDCNLCKRREYCKTKCRANKYLKRATSPFLYQEYLAEYPEAETLIAAKKLTPEQLLKMLGIEP